MDLRLWVEKLWVRSAEERGEWGPEERPERQPGSAGGCLRGGPAGALSGCALHGGGQLGRGRPNGGFSEIADKGFMGLKRIH